MFPKLFIIRPAGACLRRNPEENMLEAVFVVGLEGSWVIVTRRHTAASAGSAYPKNVWTRTVGYSAEIGEIA